MADTEGALLICAECGAAINNGNIVRYQLERYDNFAPYETRILTVDAAVACSTRCLAAYLIDLEKTNA